MLKNLFFLLAVVVAIPTLQAQSVDEILDQYFENTGGKENWLQLNTQSVRAKMEMQGMEFPATMVSKRPNKTKLTIDIQGMQMVMATDGETNWMVNPMMGSTEAQVMPEAQAKDFERQKFESEFLNYQEKGHKVALEGKETVDGVECFKVKLEKKDGEVEFHYFDTENYVVIMYEAFVTDGPMKGQEVKTYFSDYQEVDGFMLPHYIESKMGGMTLQKMTFEQYELNKDIADTEFAFPKKN